MKAASQQGAVAACRCVEYCWEARPSAAGARGSAWRWRSERSSGSATRVAAERGAPGQREGGHRAWGSPAERQRPGRVWQLWRPPACGLPVRPGRARLGLGGSRPRSGAGRGRPRGGGGARSAPLRSGAARLKAGVGSSGVLGLLVPRRSLIPGRLPGL